MFYCYYITDGLTTEHASFIVRPGRTFADGICPNSAASSTLRTSMMMASFCCRCCSTSSDVMVTTPGNSVTCIHMTALVSITTDTDLDDNISSCSNVITINSIVSNQCIKVHGLLKVSLFSSHYSIRETIQCNHTFLSCTKFHW